MPIEQKRALVLSGGSIKGGFQAGAIKAVIESGFYPDFIYGISVGSLNAAFLCNEIGKHGIPKDPREWSLIGSNLINFWKENIKKPSDIANKLSWLRIALGALFNNFNGLVDTTPLQKLVRRIIKIDNIRKSSIKLKVGAVNISNGIITYADPSYPDFIEYVLASAAIPMIMPIMKIGNQPFVDGGIKDVAPLKAAIDNGATDIIVIACQPKDMGGVSVNSGNLIHLTERVFDIMVEEIVNNDIEWSEYFNLYLPQDGTPEIAGPLAGYRRLKIKVIRPSVPIHLDLQNFDSEDIKNMIDTGYYTAKEKLK
ncbi:MAG: patatin-like phospholipase family protein [Ignavibacteriales bacterium]|nr:patatin-like phospholipase family protein [Ignavibacteriales bacterium]